MALFTALRWPERLGGLIAMSCYLPLPATLSEEASPANSALPVFMAHGTFDPVVPFGLGEAARDALLQRGHAVAWHTYQMQHGVSQQEITDVREWILRILLI